MPADYSLAWVRRSVKVMGDDTKPTLAEFGKLRSGVSAHESATTQRVIAIAKPESPSFIVWYGIIAGKLRRSNAQVAVQENNGKRV